jgi:uncharacterized protein
VDISDRLRRYFKGKDDIVLAYLFGSYASGKNTPLSDLDVAVVYRKDLANDERFTLSCQISAELADIFKVERVDVIELDEARTLLKYNIISEGIVIKDSQQRQYVEYGIIDRFLDRRHYDLRHDKIAIERFAQRGLG